MADCAVSIDRKHPESANLRHEFMIIPYNTVVNNFINSTSRYSQRTT